MAATEPNQPSPDVSELALAYLEQLDVAPAPDLSAFTQQLQDETHRLELRELVAAVQWAREHFPASLRAEAIVDGRYRLIRRLGSGGFGTVWLAEDQRLGRDVALKLVAGIGDTDAGIRALRNEVSTLARLSHRGIVRLYDSGTHDGCLFLAMEHVAGRSLADLLDALATRNDAPDAASIRLALDCPATPGETARLIDDWPRFCASLTVEMLWALAAAHGNGVVHRDLKPANVMLTGDGRPVILDFGIAGLRDHDAGTVTKGLFGTTPYMAPEQLAEGRSGKAVQVDVYQTGLILYELLTRQRAFTGTPRDVLLQKVLEGDFTPPSRLVPDLDKRLEDIVLRAMARNPQQRYPSADAFRTDLERWLAGTTPAASTGGAAMRTWRHLRGFVHRRRRPLVLLGALLLGGASTWFLNPRPLLRGIDRSKPGWVTIELNRACAVVPMAFWEDAAGAEVGHQAAVCVQPGDRQEGVLQLPAGRHELRLQLKTKTTHQPPDAKLHLRLLPTDDLPMAEALHRFQERVDALVEAQDAPLTTAEYEAFYEQSKVKVRGEAVTTFDLQQVRREAR